MRSPLSVLRRLSAGIFVLVLLLLAASPVMADTGTYKISDYVVTLEPQNDGRVLITIEQQWEVLGGSIPWVTVGMPDNNFSIEDYSGDASKVMSANDGSYYFVRIDLKENYQPGQTFDIKFTVLQGNLLERLTSEKKWRIDYTPGWYDRATTDHLQINLISPVSYQSYTSISPNPTVVNDNIITWEQYNVSPGGRLNIKVESMDGTFLTGTEPETTQGETLGATFYIFIGIIVVVGFLIIWSIRKSRQARDAEMKQRVTSIEEEMAKDEKKKAAIEEDFKEYVDTKKIQPDEQGRYYDRSYGNYITPAIWAAIIFNQHHSTPTSSPGNTNRSSCVSCACVSCACACACACAGGGAAGCSRKSLHECRTCALKKEEETGAEKSL